MTPLELVVDNPRVVQVTEQAMTWPEKARALAVTDQASYELAANTLKGIKALRSEVDAAFDPIVKSAFDAHKTAVAQKRKAEAPLTEAESIIKRSLSDYSIEQERLRQEEQRKRDEIARREEEDRRLAEAALMEREGQEFGDAALVAEAHALIEQPVTAVTAAPLPKAIPTVQGISHRMTYSAEVTSLAALVKHIAQYPNLLPLLKVDQTALNAQARSLKESLSLPGVRLVKTANVAAGRR
jgi:hypothetical protein